MEAQDFAIQKTYAGEFDATVTAFRRGAFLLDVQISQFATGCLDHADFVGAGVVAIQKSNCQLTAYLSSFLQP